MRYISLKLHRLAVLRFRSTIKLIWLSIRLVCIKADGPTTFSRPHWIVVKAGRTSCIRALAHTRDESSSLLYIRMYFPLCLLGWIQTYVDQPLSQFSSQISKKRSSYTIHRAVLLSLHQFWNGSLDLPWKLWEFRKVQEIPRVKTHENYWQKIRGFKPFCHSCLYLSICHNFTIAYTNYEPRMLFISAHIIRSV